MKRYLEDEEATRSFAETIFRALPDDKAGWMIVLSGELGAGKSTFARALIAAAGHRGPVPSPTYTLVEPYQVGSQIIYHIDLYRISGEEELHYLGWDELDDGIRLVEWPERARGLTATADLSIEFSYEGDARNVSVNANSDRAASVIQKIN